MACEDCLEVCFVGLMVERICVWCLVIAVIFMGFGKAGAGVGMLKSSIGGGYASQKRGLFSLGRQFLAMQYCCIVKLYCRSY